MFNVLRNGLLRYILYTCPKSIVMNLTTCTHGAYKIHSSKTAKDLYLTTCTHGAHKIHSCKNERVHTAKPFRVYRRGPWPRVQMRPLTACTDEAVTLPTLARTCQNHPRVLATLAQNHPRVLATPESACTADPLTQLETAVPLVASAGKTWPSCGGEP